jgi:recombinational DNA repair protein RecT
MDHMNKIEEELARKRLEHLAELGEGAKDDSHNTEEHRVRDIELEVNRLIYQKQSENIVAFRELWEKEQLNQRSRQYMRDENGLTSSHHMALEALIRRVKTRWANRDR